MRSARRSCAHGACAARPWPTAWRKRDPDSSYLPALHAGPVAVDACYRARAAGQQRPKKHAGTDARASFGAWLMGFSAGQQALHLDPPLGLPVQTSSITTVPSISDRPPVRAPVSGRVECLQCASVKPSIASATVTWALSAGALPVANSPSRRLASLRACSGVQGDPCRPMVCQRCLPWARNLSM